MFITLSMKSGVLFYAVIDKLISFITEALLDHSPMPPLCLQLWHSVYAF